MFLEKRNTKEDTIIFSPLAERQEFFVPYLRHDYYNTWLPCEIMITDNNNDNDNAITMTIVYLKIYTFAPNRIKEQVCLCCEELWNQARAEILKICKT